MEDKTKSLADRIYEYADTKEIIRAKLLTDDRVISRVTDGIYRQPASALRELISNAYDADAERVVVKTDYPRFDRIVVEDDGHGMSPAALAYLIEHIGGSAKRMSSGAGLGVTSEDNLDLSPGGRRLIGKIGIGLFSVSQLTRSFQIITKCSGDGFRTVASVSMKQFSDQDFEDKEGEFETGQVNIWTEPALDVEASGTTVVLEKIRPQAKDILRSRNVWAGLEEAERAGEEIDDKDIGGPAYHIGRVNPDDGALIIKDGEMDQRLPWCNDDDPHIAFEKLVRAVPDQLLNGDPHPSLGSVFDYYLQMVWQLALSVPVPYIEDHPFDLVVDDPDYYYVLSNDYKEGSPSRIEVTGKPVRDSVFLGNLKDFDDNFEVIFDNLSLKRPVKFNNLPTTKHAIQRNMMFYGYCLEEFEGIKSEVTGGSLEFSAYLMWNPKIVPKDHRGVLVRIFGSSGTLYDQTFLKYPVNEYTRLSQATCEVFIGSGLEGALNIDRESFNASHPHVVFLTRWLHGALRQFMNTNKALSAKLRKTLKTDSTLGAVSKIEKMASDFWREVRLDESGSPPDVVFSDEDAFPEKRSLSKHTDYYKFSKDKVFHGNKKADEVAVAKLEAITKVLASYDLLDGLSKKSQERLVEEIWKILGA